MTNRHFLPTFQPFFDQNNGLEEFFHCGTNSRQNDNKSYENGHLKVAQ
jgi:hypothetical protein